MRKNGLLAIPQRASMPMFAAHQAVRRPHCPAVRKRFQKETSLRNLRAVAGAFLKKPLASVTALLFLPLTVQPSLSAQNTRGITLQVQDYLMLPQSEKLDPATQTQGELSRVNFLREEPGTDRGRLFLTDLNGPLYILDKKTKQLTTYLDFNGRDGRKGMFHRLNFATGYQSGLITVQFDPDYRRNGKFYTIHMEDPSVKASAVPDNANTPGLDVRAYQTTETVRTSGPVTRECVLIEWTDNDTSDRKFQGTARELLRIPYLSHIHPLGDITFNPLARRGQPEYGVMYVSSGDGGSGESLKPITRNNPQRLDTMVGKILRIIPDLKQNTRTSKVSANGQYRIPDDNPFVGKDGANPEIWAYGLRNPHRLTWYVDSGAREAYLIADVIGLATWETVDIIHRGANYGYSEREGKERLKPNNRTEALPADDRIPVRIGDDLGSEMVKPTYPVLIYPHKEGGGDAVSSGFVYNGPIAALRGKFVFGDITTGRIWWADIHEMIADDDGNPATMATMHPMEIEYTNPANKTITVPNMQPIVSANYHARGGTAAFMPGYGTPVGKGRADIRLALDAKQNFYIISKSDGMLRLVTGAVEK